MVIYNIQKVDDNTVLSNMGFHILTQKNEETVTNRDLRSCAYQKEARGAAQNEQFLVIKKVVYLFKLI